MIDEAGFFFSTFPNNVGGTVDLNEKHMFSFKKRSDDFCLNTFGWVVKWITHLEDRPT